MRWSLILSAIFISFLLGACDREETASRAVTLADAALLPAELHGAHQHVREAYRYAIANSAELEKYPCYCGCNNIGHLSNKDCYIEAVKPDGEIVFDLHGTACGTCIDITQDVIRMKRKGMASPEIRRIIDQTYVSVGPPTDTPLPIE